VIRDMKRRSWPVWLAAASAVFVLFGLLLAAPCSARQQSASLGGKVEAGKYYAVRLRGLIAGNDLTVDIAVSGPLTVVLLDGASGSKWPNVPSPMFSGTASEKLHFSIRLRRSGAHFLVLDNRKNDAARSFNLRFRAESSKAPAGLGGEAPGGKDAEPPPLPPLAVQELVERLHAYFMFDDLKIERTTCGKPNAYTVVDRIIVCTELDDFVRKHTATRQQAADVEVFTVLHELGHAMLRQWKYPFYDNEEIADEFALVILDMFGQKERAASVADLFIGLSVIRELKEKVRQFDRHPLSMQRARTLRSWLADDKITRRWQSMLVPHLQTAMLEKLKRQPLTWTDLPLVEKELASRGR
jgi:Putative metallopeptidase